MNNIEIDKNVRCVSCTRQKRIDGTAWIYCEIFNNIMINVDGFDETGEKNGCTKYEKETDR